MSLRQIKLGASKLQVSNLAWGMWRFKGADVAAAQARVEAALDAGMTLLDTADIYGPDNAEPFGAAEALLGQVLKHAPHLRDRFVLASKGGIVMGVPYDSSPAYLTQAVEASLTRLGVEHIDLYQIHRPDLLAHPADVARALETLRQAGKIGEVGVSNFTVSQTAALQAHLSFPIACIQIEFSPLVISPLFDGILDQAMALGLGVLAWSPLAQGRLGDAHTDDSRVLAIRAALDQVALAHGVSRSVVAYAWIAQHPSGAIPIVGSQSPQRIANAVRAAELILERTQWYAILEASRGERMP